MSICQVASRTLGRVSRSSSSRQSVTKSYETKIGGINRVSAAQSVTRTTQAQKWTSTEQKRFIALYRSTHQPWTQYDLSVRPELARECEERVLEAYKAGDSEEANVHFHRFRSLGVLPTTETWHKILLLAYKDGNYFDIQSLFYTLISFGVVPDVHSWNFLLDVLSKRGLVRKTEEMFWQALYHTKGGLNETSFKAFFNVLMQEKRYLRAMTVVAGMQAYGFSVDTESIKTLQEACLQHISSQPGALEPLNVPAEDLPKLQAAIELDRLTFGNKHVLAVADDLSVAGRDAVLTWYSKRKNNIQAEQAYNIVLADARVAWEQHASSALGLDKLRLSVVRGWIQSGDDLSFEADIANALDASLAQEPYHVVDIANEAGATHHLLVTKQGTAFKRTVIDAQGTAVPADVQASYTAHLKSANPLELVRSTL